MSTRSRLTRSAEPRLAVIIHGVLAGYVHVAANHRLTFRYTEEWRDLPGAHPLSLSMPLTVVEHGHRATSAYLWGLLPENPDVLSHWGRLFNVPRHDVVKLLTCVGEDCAGAVQLMAPDRLDELLGAPTLSEQNQSVEWLTPREVGRLLKAIRHNPAAARNTEGQGQFSLAGAQPKTVLYQNTRGRWGIPRRRMPSNRILKPPVLPLDDLAYNEFACLQLARELGLAACASSVQQFDDEIAIVVERYDRIRIANSLRRIHQEDMCQALSVLPTRKYETDGGPGITDIAAVLSRYSSSADVDILRLLDAIIFNWLIGGTDAHAKNYALLFGGGDDVRLAPLYDLISALPYPQFGAPQLRLAMSVGGEYVVERVTSQHWHALARAIGVRPSGVLERIAEMAYAFPAAAERVITSSLLDADTRPILERLLAPVLRHVALRAGLK